MSNDLFPSPWFLGGTPPSARQRAQMPHGYVSMDTNWGTGSGHTTPTVVLPRGYTPEMKVAGQKYLDNLKQLYKGQFGIDVKPNFRYSAKPGVRGRSNTVHLEPGAVHDKRFTKWAQSPEGLAWRADNLRNTFGAVKGAQIGLPHGGLTGRDKGAVYGDVSEVGLAQQVLDQIRQNPNQGAVPGAPGSIIPPLPQRRQFQTEVERTLPEPQSVSAMTPYEAPQAQMPYQQVQAQELPPQRDYQAVEAPDQQPRGVQTSWPYQEQMGPQALPAPTAPPPQYLSGQHYVHLGVAPEVQAMQAAPEVQATQMPVTNDLTAETIIPPAPQPAYRVPPPPSPSPRREYFSPQGPDQMGTPDGIIDRPNALAPAGQLYQNASGIQDMSWVNDAFEAGGGVDMDLWGGNSLFEGWF